MFSVILRIVLLLIMMSFTEISAQDINSLKVKYYGRLWNAGQAGASIISQDGGFSYTVPGGSLWWFGDTFKGTRDNDGKPHFEGGAVSCCTAFLNSNDKSVLPVLQYLKSKDGTVEQAVQFLPDESWDHNRIWPMSGVFINGKSYLYYTLIETEAKGEWDFKHVGCGLAYAENPVQIHKRIIINKSWRFPVTPSAIVVTKDWIYLYEVEKKGNKQGLWLARVKPDNIEKPDAYQFYCGNGNYDTDISRQEIFMENIYGQVSVAWNEYLNKYLLLSSSDFFRSREIRFYTSLTPDGNFEKSSAVVTVPVSLQGKEVNLVYCSYLHPELFRENGQVLNITFSLNLKNSEFDANNEMIEVELN